MRTIHRFFERTTTSNFPEAPASSNSDILTAEIEEKTGRLVDLLGRERLSGILLNAQHNFAWLTGGASNAIDISRENGAASLLVTSRGRRYLLSNNIEMPRMLAEQVSSSDFEPVEFTWQEEKMSPAVAVEKAEELAGGTVATDIAIAPGTRPVESLVAKCRYSLTADEIDRMRNLGTDASRALDTVAVEVQPGETEGSIAERVRGTLGREGISSVVTLVSADERIARFRHPVPTDKAWKRTLLLVTCAKRKGLIVSLSRIVCVGPVPDELTRKTEAAAFIHASLLNATRPGTPGRDLYTTAAEAYASAGFADELNKHHQGGAAGYRTRDWVIHPTSDETVQMHQAFAWNPSITGTKVEETVIVTGNGTESITRSARFPEIAIQAGGQTYLSPGILSL